MIAGLAYRLGGGGNARMPVSRRRASGLECWLERPSACIEGEVLRPTYLAPILSLALNVRAMHLNNPQHTSWSQDSYCS